MEKLYWLILLDILIGLSTMPKEKLLEEENLFLNKTRIKFYDNVIFLKHIFAQLY